MRLYWHLTTSQAHIYFRFNILKFTNFSSTSYSSNQIELTANPLHSKLVDASVAATIEEVDIAPHDMMTCEVMIAGTDYDKRVEKNILEKSGMFKK